MNIIFENHKQFLLALLESDIEFILIGGYSVIYHGYARTTGDMDLWLKPDEITKQKLMVVLKNFGVKDADLKKLSKLDFTEVLAFHIGNPPERIDFLTKIAGLEFDSSYLRCNKLPLKNYNIPVLHLDDLIINKLLSGRMKDKADVEELKKINKRKWFKRK
jgi:hypothetical protein